MSSQEKRFIVVSPSHHKKPRTMFLNKTNSGKCVWCDTVPYISTLWLLSDAQAFAVSSPVSIWFIEDKFWISTLEAGDMPKFADMLKYAQKAECEIIRYKSGDIMPPIVAPSEQELANEALRELAKDLADRPLNIAIIDDSPNNSKAAYEEAKKYFVYLKQDDYNTVVFFNKKDYPKSCISKSSKYAASLFDINEAMEIVSSLDAGDKCQWAYQSSDIVEEQWITPDRLTLIGISNAANGSCFLTCKINNYSKHEKAADHNDEGKEIISALKQTFGDNPKVITLPKAELVEMLDNLPQNRPLYKDSGSWQIRTDDMEEVLYQQDVNESFFDFIKRAYSKENFFKE